MTDCEAASGSWQLYGESLARRDPPRQRGEQGNGGSRRGWSCVGRGTPADGSSALGVAWRATAQRGTAQHGAARRGAARRGVAQHGAAHRIARAARHGATRLDATLRDAAEGRRKARLPAHARPCLRLRAVASPPPPPPPSSLCSQASSSRFASRRLRPSLSLSGPFYCLATVKRRRSRNRFGYQWIFFPPFFPYRSSFPFSILLPLAFAFLSFSF